MNAAGTTFASGRRGAFSATKMWNELIRVFRSSMPLKTHKRKMKTYVHCFTACDAISVMHEILKSQCKPDADRLQAKKLLQKFLMFKVIENVKEKENDTFEDEKHQLFRFQNFRASKVSQPQRRAPLKNICNRVSTPSNRRLRSLTVSGIPYSKQKNVI